MTDDDKGELELRMADYFNPRITWADMVAEYPGFGAKFARYEGERVRGKLLATRPLPRKTNHDPDKIVRCLVRPLDARWLYWEPPTQTAERTAS